jgi:hypothetical protein
LATLSMIRSRLSRFLRNIGLHEIRPRRRKSPLPDPIPLLAAGSEQETDEIGQMLRRRFLTKDIHVFGDVVTKPEIAFDHRTQGPIVSERPCQLRVAKPWKQPALPTRPSGACETRALHLLRWRS